MGNLEKAIRSGSLSAAHSLLAEGSDVNKWTSEGLTPLMIASAIGQSQMVDLLLTAGADILRLEPRMGASALHKAAQSGNPDVVRLLLDAGAFIDQQSPVLGNTALMDAVIHRHPSVVRLLLKRGAKTYLRNHWNQTAMELSQLDQNDAILTEFHSWLEMQKARPNAPNLITAIKSGNVSAVDYEVRQGACLDERLPMQGDVDDDYTPLGCAVRAGNSEIVCLLLAGGATPRQMIGLMKGTPVHEAAFLGRADLVSIFADLAEHTGQPAIELDAQGPYNGFTPMHDAVWHGHIETVQALLNAGAPVHIRSHSGLTPRELAQLYGYEKIVELLRGAETDCYRG